MVSDDDLDFQYADGTYTLSYLQVPAVYDRDYIADLLRDEDWTEIHIDRVQYSFYHQDPTMEADIDRDIEFELGVKLSSLKQYEFELKLQGVASPDTIADLVEAERRTASRPYYG